MTCKPFLFLIAWAFTSIHAQPAPLLNNPCLTEEFSGAKFCDSSLSDEARVQDIIDRLSWEEKVDLVGDQMQPSIPSIGLNNYSWWNEASTGVATSDEANIATTKFAFPITTGMSFNRTLWHATGTHIGREARALMNDGKLFSTFWAPVVNLAREPRWGRNIEVPSEDPYQSGEYAVQFVQGFQEAPEDPDHVQASACCKHFIANEMEDSSEVGYHDDRNHVDSQITQQDLMDSYMPPFQACVEEGRVTSLMCSYNAVNGVPSCANDWLLNTLARDEWGFEGAIVSDCDADRDVFESHNFTETPEESVQKILRAGTDVDCGHFIKENLESALNKDVITMDDIDLSIARQFSLRMRLSHFDESPLQTISMDEVCSDAGVELSHDGLRQSAALLKNEDGTLPLNADETKSVAVIGPNSELGQATASYYGPPNHCLGDFTLVDAIQAFVKNTTTIAGIDKVLSEDTSGIPAAVEAAKKADQVVLAVGTDLTWAKEAHDAASIAFTDAQAQLIKEVSAAAAKPVVLVLFTATPLDLTDVLANDKIGAVLHVGQPSVTIVSAGDLLFGKTSPAGRLVQTVYKKEYQDQISIFDFNMRPGPSGTNPGRTYRFFTGEPVVPFGFGLSYTTFDYQVVGGAKTFDLKEVKELLDNEENAMPKRITARGSDGYVVRVTNTGDMDADEVVLGFVTPPGAGVNGTPLKQLFNFERVHVKAGESVEVTLIPALTDFTVVNADGVREALAGEYSFEFGVRGLAFTDFNVRVQ
ncbi:hypothetical protein TrVE_jg11584 [Triparma verrucosa]|uniref:Fibronectin type III-like domain-containing protein n=1 Tax=Triparma verrucosa TaxID=1606542 RepID=A0A9W7BAP8_9STRA|nr:hypothetical protein TrVE_jg11584 [Triparma verrucosa]